MRLVKFGLFLALVAAACFPAAAQTGLRFNVPFEFVAGGKVMPAGQYKVVPVFRDSNAAWTIVGAGGSTIFLTNQVQSTKTAHEISLVFLRAGGQLSLAEIWSSEEFGREVMRTNVKKNLVAQGATYVEISGE